MQRAVGILCTPVPTAASAECDTRRPERAAHRFRLDTHSRDRRV